MKHISQPHQPATGSDSLHVLIVEDDHTDLLLVQRYVSKAFTGSSFDEVSTLAAALHQLDTVSYDFVILDIMLPDSSGLDTLRAIMEKAHHIPVLVYSGQQNPEMALEAMKIGAQDFLIKGRGDEFTFRRIMQYSIERKRTEMRIYRNEQMLRMFIKHSPAGIAVLDRDLKVIMCSDRWLEEHGFANQDMTGQPLEAVFRDAADKWRFLCERCITGESIQCHEDRFVLDGREEYIRWELMPWFDERGEIGGVIQFTEFVTDEYQMRKALEEAKQDLELKVKLRTHDLEAALEEVENAQAAKSEFFANITHELRTPLHAIINFSKFGIKKIDTAPKEKLVEYYEDIHKSGKRLLGLVNDILDLTKEDMSKEVLALDQQSLEELFEGARKEISSISESRNVTVLCQIDPAVSYVACDQLRIHQVLINLLSNAIKFSSEGTQVWISATPSSQCSRLAGEEGRVVITVKDQGAGIPEGELDTIFDEFAQSSKVKSGTFIAGTGLGLSICRHIVTRHGGKIWAENNADKVGASISFTLPVKQEIKGGD